MALLDRPRLCPLALWHPTVPTSLLTRGHSRGGYFSPPTRDCNDILDGHQVNENARWGFIDSYWKGKQSALHIAQNSDQLQPPETAIRTGAGGTITDHVDRGADFFFYRSARQAARSHELRPMQEPEDKSKPSPNPPDIASDVSESIVMRRVLTVPSPTQKVCRSRCVYDFQGMVPAATACACSTERRHHTPGVFRRHAAERCRTRC